MVYVIKPGAEFSVIMFLFFNFFPSRDTNASKLVILNSRVSKKPSETTDGYSNIKLKLICLSVND